MSAYSHPYPLRGIRHLSATAIKDYSTCEAMAAYQRNFVGVPPLPLPIAIAFGIALHKLLERSGRHWWETYQQTGRPFKDGREGTNWVRAAVMFVGNVLDGKHGPRSESSQPEKLLWFSERQLAGLDPAETAEKFQKRRDNYLGRTYFAMEAFRQQFAIGWPDLQRIEFEVPLRSKHLYLETADGQWRYPIKGSIDIIRFFAAAYEADDYKSGWIINRYRERKYLIEDLQMTLYVYALTRLYGRPPDRIFIQPLEISREDLNRRGPETLRACRIYVPPRGPEHIAEILALGQDVRELVDRVVRWRSYSDREREEWQPHSEYGRKSGFVDSVRECRFVPRPGKWCDLCSFQNLCQRDHPADWARYEKLSQLASPTVAAESAPLVLPTAVKPAAPEMLPFIPFKPKKLGISDAERKRAMIASRDFLPRHQVMSNLKRLRDLVLQGGEVCDCLRLDLYPVWLLRALPLFLKKATSPDLKTLAAQCPYANCSRRIPAPELLSGQAL